VNAPELYVNFFQAFANVARKDHYDYVGTDRPHGQAASFEALLAFRNCCRDAGLTHVSPILDAGAGASSAVLRNWFGNVTSCDPNAEYLIDVKKACAALANFYKLPHLGSGDWVPGFPQSGVFDACFYDYGAIERKPNLEQAIRMTKHIVYVDDADNRADCLEMRMFVFETLNKVEGWIPVDALCAEDEHQRWGIMLVRPESWNSTRPC